MLNFRSVALAAVSASVMVGTQNLPGAEITWGGSSGRWQDAANWVGNAVPAAGDAVIFPAGADCTVEIAKNTEIISSIRLSPGKGKVTFAGNKKITLDSSGYAFYVGENRHAVVDGCELYVGQDGVDDLEVGPGARFDVVSGKTFMRYGNILVNTNATLNVYGGSLIYNSESLYLKLAKEAKVNFAGGSNVIGRIVNKVSENKGTIVSEFDGDGSKVVFLGGYTEFPSRYAFSSYVDHDKTHFEFLGGTLNQYCRLYGCSKTLLPSRNALLINRCPGLSMQDVEREKVTSEADVWELGGTAVFTDRSSYALVGSSPGTAIRGGGEMEIGSIHIGTHNCDMDLGRINIVSNFYSYSDGTLYFRDGITIGALDDVTVITEETGKFAPCGAFKIDTVDAEDGTTPRSFDLHSRFSLSGVTSFEVEGAGTVGIDPEVSFKYLHRFSADEGATVALTNAKAQIIASSFSLGANSTFLVGTNAVDVAAMLSLGDGSKIRYSFDSLQAGTMYPLWFGPHGSVPPVTHFEFEPALPDGWEVAVNGSTAYLWDGTIVDAENSKSNWLGVEGGNWNVEANWGESKIPGGNTSYSAKFTGNRQLSVTNDYSGAICWMRNLLTSESSGPYVMTGKPLSPFYSVNWGSSSSSVANNSRFPFVVDAEVRKHWRTGEGDSVQSFFTVQANSEAPVVLSGGGLLTNAVLRYRGDVRVGGNWVTLGLNPVSGGGRDTRFVLLPGAYLETTEQGSNQTVTASYQISAGSGMTLNGSVWRWTTTENTHFVDGVVTSTCPVQATARQTFIGDGVLSLAMVQSDAEGSGDLKFAEDITVRPAGWKTVRAGADNPMTMVVRGNATIGAWGDWTYGAEDGFESATAAVDRALKVVGGAKTCVSFDTEGNTVTLKDPLVIEKWATVLKKGEGALALKSDENDLADSEIELLGGELRMSGAEAFGKLTFAGGKIAVENGFEADVYTTLFTAKKIIGEVEVAGRFNVTTEADDNGVTVSVRRKLGTAIIMR